MSTQLNRSVSLTGLVFYGIGTMVGGGIYALLGKVVGVAGLLAPWSMLIAGTMAVFSALTFAELSARMPSAGGPAKYISEAFNSNRLGSLIGWLVIVTGIVSAATLTVAMSGFFFDLMGLPMLLGKILSVTVLLLLACWGINQSVMAVAIITLVEVIGLVLVVLVNAEQFTQLQLDIAQFIPDTQTVVWSGIIAGSFIAFYAFIGFEDMVALAEEVKATQRNLPIAIIISVAVTLILYIAISFTAVISGDLEAFASSNTPMAHLVKSSGWLSPQVLVIISLLAGFNGALVQIIMASRILFGMSSEHQAPKYFKLINPKTQTPIRASLAIAIILLTLSLLVELLTLAKITSGIILIVFASMNLSLIKIKLNKNFVQNKPDYCGFQVPVLVPTIGLVVSLASLIFATLATFQVSH